MRTPPFMITYPRLKVVNRLTAACVMASPLVAFAFGMSWGLLLATLVIWQFMQVVGLVVGAHRYFSHRMFATNRVWQWIMAVSCVGALTGPPCVWADLHIKHHKHADDEDDPYIDFIRTGVSPFSHENFKGNRTLLKMLASDPMHGLTIKYYFLIVLTLALVLTTIGTAAGLDPLTALFWLYLVPGGLCHMTLRFVVWSGHVPGLGYRNHETPDNSHNWWLVSLISGGEGWHNNHHHDQTAVNLRQKWWEFDPAYWIIKAIRK